MLAAVQHGSYRCLGLGACLRHRLYGFTWRCEQASRSGGGTLGTTGIASHAQSRGRHGSYGTSSTHRTAADVPMSATHRCCRAVLTPPVVPVGSVSSSGSLPSTTPLAPSHRATCTLARRSRWSYSCGRLQGRMSIPFHSSRTAGTLSEHLNLPQSALAAFELTDDHL